MDTICRDCVFAVWEGDQQTQCKFDRLQKMQDNGTTIVEEEDNGRVYMKILGRFCNTCRNADAVKDIPVRKRMEVVRQEVRLPIALAVYMGPDEWPTQALLTLETIINQEVKPAEVILIYNIDGKQPPSSFTEWFIDTCPLPWRIENIREKCDYGRAVDLTVQSKEMKAVYFAVAKAGYEYPLDFIAKIDHSVNDDMERFVALLPDENGNGMFIQTNLYNLLQGNKSAGGCDNIMDKIQTIASEEGTSHMIRTYEEL